MSQPEKPGEAALRKQFPTLYITLVSIVVALAIEGLLAQVAEIDFSVLGLSQVVTLLQVVHLIGTASVIWWVSSRWVTTAPWPFGLFDGFGMIALLILLHFMSQEIGGSFSGWITWFGIVGLAAGFIYRFNGKRGIIHTGRSAELVQMHRLPTAVFCSAGVWLLGCAFLIDGLDDLLIWQLVIVLAGMLLTGLGAYTDYWIWSKVSAEPSRFD